MLKTEDLQSLDIVNVFMFFLVGNIKKRHGSAGISMDFPPFGAEILPMTSENLKINASHVDVDPGSWNTS